MSARLALATVASASCPIGGCGGATPGQVQASLDPFPSRLNQPMEAVPLTWVSPHSYASYVRGQVLAGRGEHRAAVDAFQAAIDESGSDPWVESQLALSESALGHHDRALLRLDRAIAESARRPQGPDPALLSSRGAIRQRMGQHEAALADYALAARFDRRGEVATPLAALLERTGQPERAVAVLQAAHKQHPRHGIAAARLALRLSLARHDAAATDAALARLSSLRAMGRDERLSLARDALSADRPWLAIRVLQSAPENRETTGLLLAARLATGDADGATSLLELATPADLGGPLPMARAWLQVGAPGRALELAQQVLETGGPSGDGANEALDRDRARTLIAEAQLAMGAPLAALQALAALPAASPLRPAAQALAARALEQLSLPHSARDLLGVGPHSAGTTAQ